MRVYRIRDKQTGLFFSNIYQWTKVGKLYTRPNDAKVALRRCSGRGRNAEIVSYLLIEEAKQNNVPVFEKF